MTLTTRIDKLYTTFYMLEQTSSLIDKRKIVDNIDSLLKDDFNFCIEVLAGKHKLGYTMYNVTNMPEISEDCTIRQAYDILLTPLRKKNLSVQNISKTIRKLGYHSAFFAILANREWKLGIGNSLLTTAATSPMLAKKFEERFIYNKSITVTEKLDGNRCIAYYDNDKQEWKFVSRSGKPLRVSFNMDRLNVNYIYDGEILSKNQVKMSEEIYDAVFNKIRSNGKHTNEFNKTSGIINSNYFDKDLVYNIFDICNDSRPYYIRRFELTIEFLKMRSDNVRLLPVLITNTTDTSKFMDITDTSKFMDTLYETLDIVTSYGGEGLMLNDADAAYEHKRTSSLLKLKPSYTMDLIVDSIEYGKGKYEGQVGALHCSAKVGTQTVKVDVGAGLTDEQRLAWAIDESQIVNKVVEVVYSEISKNKTSSTYSLRFPRLKRVRDDKSIPSID